MRKVIESGIWSWVDGVGTDGEQAVDAVDHYVTVRHGSDTRGQPPDLFALHDWFLGRAGVAVRTRSTVAGTTRPTPLTQPPAPVTPAIRWPLERLELVFHGDSMLISPAPRYRLLDLEAGPRMQYCGSRRRIGRPHSFTTSLAPANGSSPTTANVTAAGFETIRRSSESTTEQA